MNKNPYSKYLFYRTALYGLRSSLVQCPLTACMSWFSARILMFMVDIQ